MTEGTKGITVAITGSSGYLASGLLTLLESDKEVNKVIGIDLSPPSSERCTPKFKYHPVNILEYDKMVDIFRGVDVVVHMVFNVNGMHDKKKLYEVNIKGSQNVIKAASVSGVKKIVFTSSIAAYGAHPDNKIPLKESDPLRGKGTFFYSEQKQAVEEYLDDFERSHPEMKIIRLRFCTTTGPQSTNETVTLYTSPVFVAFPFNQPPVQLLHEDDAARAFHLAVVKGVNGAFNIGSDWEMSAKEHARLAGAFIIYLPVWLSRGVARLLWWLRLVKFDPSWINASLYPVVTDITNAEKILGWKPKYKSKEIILSLLKKDKKLK